MYKYAIKKVSKMLIYKSSYQKMDSVICIQCIPYNSVSYYYRQHTYLWMNWLLFRPTSKYVHRGGRLEIETDVPAVINNNTFHMHSRA